jgi:hypothetical protein
VLRAHDRSTVVRGRHGREVFRILGWSVNGRSEGCRGADGMTVAQISGAQMAPVDIPRPPGAGVNSRARRRGRADGGWTADLPRPASPRCRPVRGRRVKRRRKPGCVEPSGPRSVVAESLLDEPQQTLGRHGARDAARRCLAAAS